MEACSIYDEPLFHHFIWWKTFGKKRIERLQQDEQTQLQEGDVVNLDDTSCAHPYAKQLPFLSWLFDHSTKTYSWAMNLVASGRLKKRARVSFVLFDLA